MTTAQLLEIADYAGQSRDFLAKSRDYLAADDLHQASEKGWGAASHMAKAVAAAHGWEYDSHADFHDVLFQAGELSGNPRIYELSGIPNNLHINYYRRKRHLNALAIGVSLTLVAELVELLAPLTALPEGE